ncbi:alanine--tRNA ligase [uncultured Marivirga sp.]|uniref:alanine--tRNA ligase n=1 Tax=uncultured Marivirga sp. TaxID=1123707 RepID=UPI0030EDF727|tara:strand:+ start:92964 stop:95594 length:2631 start_codon:yes stop_codon:yes gene_type:complete
MTSSEIRKKFLNYFQEKQHKIVPSAPMVIKDDPTLMFTNAGMNQFKDYFLGNKSAEATRVTDTQKCLRVSGKHNDLEEVGHDTYHHTMFEMLGNWSFGDYFKKEAIAWSWELLTEVYKLPKERLYVTVFEGDKADNIPFDQEAYDFWKYHIDESRILKGDKSDNFWEMGDTGPCGPASEIHVDLRDEADIAKIPGKDLVNNDHPLVVEIWNLVFIQFNRKADGSLHALPAKHIDTGMGFERICMAIQNKKSNYDTDVFTPLLDEVAKISGKKYGELSKIDIAFRVIVDHIRAISLSISDGQLPSNNKAGYVIRRILRRAVRYGYTFLDLKEPFLYKLVSILAKQFEEVFSELKAQQELVEKVVKEEETAFLRTLENGLRRLDSIKAELSQSSKSAISGAVAFELYDTYGFPLDLTALIAKENGLTVDEKGFEQAMTEQKNRSKSAAKMETGDWKIVNEGSDVEFVGYDENKSEAKILRYRAVKTKNKEQIQVVLDKTPFYAESGGQIGDTGNLKIGDQTIKVLDTKKENDLIVHFVDKIPSRLDAKVYAEIDNERRRKIVYNHSATHLLHAALREILGDHVQQKGSLVSDKILRFDFSHFSKMTDEEILKVERRVNEKIRENIPQQEERNIPIEEAKAKGAMALFGEKYGDNVRMITFDPNYSVELCGGVHVSATGNIGQFKITTETSVAAGIRRIEAVTGEKAEEYHLNQEAILKQVNALLKSPKDLAQAVEQLMKEKNELQKSLEKEQSKQAGQLKDELIKNAEKKGDITVIISEITLPNADALKKLSFELKNEVDSLFAVLACEIDGKPQISVVISDNLVENKDLNAGKIIRDLAKNIQGGGGGQAFFATAGGKKLEGLADVVAQAKTMAKEL